MTPLQPQDDDGNEACNQPWQLLNDCNDEKSTASTMPWAAPISESANVSVMASTTMPMPSLLRTVATINEVTMATQKMNVWEWTALPNLYVITP